VSNSRIPSARIRSRAGSPHGGCAPFLLLFLGTIGLFHSAAIAAGPALSVCYNYGCKRQAQFTMSENEWQRVVSLFEPGAETPDSERAAIRRAVAEMESTAGRYTPVRRDRGGNPAEAEWPGQLDCIDESTNTTTYLLVIERAGMLRWHRVAERVFRAPYLFDEHWAAQIEEIRTGRRYAVDSWMRDNGYPPDIQPVTEWKRKAPVPGVW